jgi:cephalosporin hydroxylase
MKNPTKVDVEVPEFENQFWFFQLVVWLDFLADPLPDTVIETGTHHGSGAFRWSRFFNAVHTVELSEELYNSSRKKYGHIDSITFHNNNSIDFLKEFLPKTEDRCIIFLDAHGSGGDTVYDEEVGRYGSPVLGELLAIKDFSVRNDHIIIVDDCDDLGTMNYPSKHQVEEVILEINPDYYIELDIPKHLLMSRGTGIIYLPGG